MSRASDRAAQGGDDYRIADSGWGGYGYRSAGAEGAVTRSLFRSSKADAERLKGNRAGDTQREQDETPRGYTTGGTIMLYTFNRLRKSSAMEVTTPGGIRIYVSYDTPVGFYSELLRMKDEKEGVLPEEERGYRWRMNEWGITTGRHLNEWGSSKEYRLERDKFARAFDKAFAEMSGRLSHDVRAVTLQAQAPVYEALEALENYAIDRDHDKISAARIALKKAIEVFEEERSA